MIEKLKQRPKKLNQNNLNFVNPWWEKKLIKNGKKVEKYLDRFGRKDILTNTPVSKDKVIDYQKYVEFSDKTLEFMLQKEKQMAKEIKVVQKLRKMISAFGEQAGILAFLQAIDKYYTEINKNDVAQKHQLAIEIGNETILKMYDAYKEMILNVFKDEPEFKEKILALYATNIVLENKLFDGSQTLQFLFRFVGTAFRKEKISKETFSQIYFNTIFINAYLSTFSQEYIKFTNQIQY